jgi:hypothetical protein
MACTVCTAVIHDGPERPPYALTTTDYRAGLATTGSQSSPPLHTKSPTACTSRSSAPPHAASRTRRSSPPDPRRPASGGEALPATTEEGIRRCPCPVRASRARAAVRSWSHLWSHPPTFVYVHRYSNQCRRCRSRTLTVFGELLSRVLKIGRSTVRPRPWPPPLKAQTLVTALSLLGFRLIIVSIAPMGRARVG